MSFEMPSWFRNEALHVVSPWAHDLDHQVCGVLTFHSGLVAQSCNPHGL